MVKEPVRLHLDRPHILAYRRRVAGLDRRRPADADSLREAAWAGLSDSMPRAAVLSLHARLEGVAPGSWEDPALAQVWGPRFSAYVVPARDHAVFTVGRWPDDPKRLQLAEDLANRIADLLQGTAMAYGEVGRALGVNPNALRYATTTGRILIRWDGARQPTIRTVPTPEVDLDETRSELARRYLHVFGPATADGFASWAGLKPKRAHAQFESLRASLTQVDTPIGEGWILAEDEVALRGAEPGPGVTRLLPSGDTYFLLQGADRQVLVPAPERRAELWTSRVWPGAVLLGGDIVGIWRRAEHRVTVHTWRRLSGAERDSVEAEAVSLPIPDLQKEVAVAWTD